MDPHLITLNWHHAYFRSFLVTREIIMLINVKPDFHKLMNVEKKLKFLKTLVWKNETKQDQVIMAHHIFFD